MRKVISLYNQPCISSPKPHVSSKEVQSQLVQGLHNSLV